ncbi:MAG TPA: hypothetical protein VEN95_12395 [Actinomycetota bacterium]|jgi:hypothetical protein|nr:hypothetical protein [Actinomycetota bacterium]
MAESPSRRTNPPRSLFRRIERWGVGLILGVVAFFLERAVVRSIRRGETKAKPSQPTALKGTGSDIEPADVDD